MPQLRVPENVGSREQARELLADLPASLAGQRVTLDCRNLMIPTPSFLDEIVKQVLIERDAKLLELDHASLRARTLAERSAENRGVRQRLVLAPT
jgi:hypothetical protein